MDGMRGIDPAFLISSWRWPEKGFLDFHALRKFKDCDVPAVGQMSVC